MEWGLSYLAGPLGGTVGHFNRLLGASVGLQIGGSAYSLFAITDLNPDGDQSGTFDHGAVF
jgi:hypothetical protein